jgi:hypothetical protein
MLTKFVPTMNAKFPVYIASVNIHRMEAHIQSDSYLLQPKAIEKEFKYLSLTRWKIVLVFIQLSKERN